MYQQSAPESIQAMFASIAANYDKANSINSLGLHKLWNKKLINAIGAPSKLLDLCAGTGDIAFGFLEKNPQSEAILLDFCPEMLSVAQNKAKQKGDSFFKRTELIVADATSIPLAEKSVDAVSISYGIRNVKETEKCFKEAYRVLCDHGNLCILELTRPTFYPLKALHKLYTSFFLPRLGKIVTKSKDPYTYLCNSVQTFTSPKELETNLREAGFQSIQLQSLMGGIATLTLAKKQPKSKID